MIGDTLFVTGTQRSGTTLLEKLLAAQPAVALLSQPFPLLFVEAKRAFLRSLGAGDERYPLGHLFRESRYEAEDFCSFLARWRVSRSELTAVFERMHDYSGQYTKFTREQLDEAFSRISDEDDFADVVARLVRSLAPRAPETRWFGSKETICEEFVPYLLGRGFRCAIIIRDPRDVVASLNHGRGQAFGGAIKPLWFNVRNWRKSVALALSLEGHPQFHWCRYEDLVHDPAGTLGGVAGWLDVAVDAERVGGELRDASGEVWRGNSSHREHSGVSASSVGTFRSVLPASVAEAIEAACLPELRVLGYETSMSHADATLAIMKFADPYTVRQDGMERDLDTPENRAIEVERLERLGRPADAAARQWFLDERVHDRLRAGLGA